MESRPKKSKNEVKPREKSSRKMNRRKNSTDTKRKKTTKGVGGGERASGSVVYTAGT